MKLTPRLDQKITQAVQTSIETPATSSVRDDGIAAFFGCLPDFPEREQQGEYDNRQELD